jgi:FdhD protein
VLRVPCQRWRGRRLEAGEDALVVEAPLEFQVRGQALAAVLRTPGDDRDLALGFFFTEGWIQSRNDVGSLCLCARLPAAGNEPRAHANVANLIPASTAAPSAPPRPRPGPIVSSCGACGKATLEEILQRVPASHRPGSGAPLRVSARLLAGLPEKLRQRQALFDDTGALHAAGVFDLEGEPIVVKEDIGRHNAVDKAIGAGVRTASLPWSERILVVSGRASFEIVQKALRAGIAVVAAVSGVSQLARDLAAAGDMTLCGFARGQSMAIYTHPGRLH